MEKHEFNTAFEMATWINNNISDPKLGELKMMDGIRRKKVLGRYIIFV